MKKLFLLVLAVLTALGSNAQNFTPVPVIEEFTGTWCPWCPQGIEGMRQVHEEYGDRVVLIALHCSSDPMKCTDFEPIYSQATSFPASMLNRDLSVFPNPYFLKQALSNALAETASASIEMLAEWGDASKTSVLFTTQTTFANSQNGSNYGIAFVLTEDGMSGTGSRWGQQNGLSHNDEHGYSTAYPYWYNAPSVVTDIEYQHVAVAAWDIQYGVDGSVSSSQGGVAQSFTYLATLSDAAKSLIQDKSKLKAIALLINRSTGKIINAAQNTIGEMGTGILPIDNGRLLIDNYYTLDGRKLKGKPTTSGIYIVNGHKVVIK